MPIHSHHLFAKHIIGNISPFLVLTVDIEGTGRLTCVPCPWKNYHSSNRFEAPSRRVRLVLADRAGGRRRRENMQTVAVVDCSTESHSCTVHRALGVCPVALFAYERTPAWRAILKCGATQVGHPAARALMRCLWGSSRVRRMTKPRC